MSEEWHQLRPQLVDAAVDRIPFRGHFSFLTPRELVGKGSEAVEQFRSVRRDFRFAPEKLFELDRKCVKIGELGDGHPPFLSVVAPKA